MIKRILFLLATLIFQRIEFLIIDTYASQLGTVGILVIVLFVQIVFIIASLIFVRNVSTKFSIKLFSILILSFLWVILGLYDLMILLLQSKWNIILVISLYILFLLWAGFKYPEDKPLFLNKKNFFAFCIRRLGIYILSFSLLYIISGFIKDFGDFQSKFLMFLPAIIFNLELALKNNINYKNGSKILKLAVLQTILLSISHLIVHFSYLAIHGVKFTNEYYFFPPILGSASIIVEHFQIAVIAIGIYSLIRRIITK